MGLYNISYIHTDFILTILNSANRHSDITPRLIHFSISLIYLPSHSDNMFYLI